MELLKSSKEIKYETTKKYMCNCLKSTCAIVSIIRINRAHITFTQKLISSTSC